MGQVNKVSMSEKSAVFLLHVKKTLLWGKKKIMFFRNPKLISHDHQWWTFTREQ